MSGHTPGPWLVGTSGHHVYYVNPRIEAGESIDDQRHDSVIARCTEMGPESGIPDDEITANARLIAAAPDLLAAAKKAASLLWEVASEVEDGVRTMNEDSPDGIAWTQLTDAIAKAGGRS